MYHIQYIVCCVCVFIMPDLLFVMCKQLCKQQKREGATKTKQNGTLITLAGLKALITAGLILQCWQSQKNN